MSTAEQSDLAQEQVRPIIEWLTTVHGQARDEDIDTLREHLKTLRLAEIPPPRRLQLLDFLHDHAQKVVGNFLPTMHDISLPVSRKARQKIRATQSLLEALAQDYEDALGALLEPGADTLLHRAAGIALWRSVNCLCTHLTISNLASSPAEAGIWHQLHRTYCLARNHELHEQRVPRHPLNLEQLYLSSLVFACSQPSSFSSYELEFIDEYIRSVIDDLTLEADIPFGRTGLYWIDPDRDTPANPLQRRTPPVETPKLWYFACDRIAVTARGHYDSLKEGYPAHQLGLPPFAETPAGQGILQRLSERWGNPPKRRFPRRRHSYRTKMCSGIDDICRLLKSPDDLPPGASEWMVTNESPDGCAMMHVSGKTVKLRVGDLVATRAESERGAPTPNWIISIVRWGISENPEHIELGLQILSPSASPARVTMSAGGVVSGATSAILLPSIPPIRPTEALVVHSGTFARRTDRFTLVIDSNHTEVRELAATGITEQTGSIEIFSVAASGKR